ELLRNNAYETPPKGTAFARNSQSRHAIGRPAFQRAVDRGPGMGHDRGWSALPPTSPLPGGCMPSRSSRAIALALLSAAVAVSCSKKGGTAPNNTVSGPTFSFDFPVTASGGGLGTSDTLTFKDVGTWTYHCIAHGTNGGPMVGTVIVDPASPFDSA